MTQESLHPLPLWSHNRPITTFMLFISVIAIGIVSLVHLPLEFSPEVEHPWFWIVIGHPNSSPGENDREIGSVLEEHLKRVRSIERMSVRSSSQEVNSDIQFKRGVDMDAGFLELRDACDRAELEFPASADRLRVYHNKSSDWPILWLGVAWDVDSEKLIRTLEDRIIPALERINGIAQVEAHGMDPKNLFIHFDLAKLHSHQIDMFHLYRDLNFLNRNTSLGMIESSGKKLLIRNVSGLTSREEYQDIPVADGRLNLSQIADIQYRLPKKTEAHRFNGKSGTSLSIKKSSQANTVEVSERVNRALDELANDPDLKGINFIHLFDQADWIKSSLSNLRSSGTWGALFAAIVLILFLRRLGATLIILAAVPASVLAALAGLYFLGYTLNIGTMAGLMLAIGMLVDNSIVVAENIFRLRQSGLDHATASIQGAGAVGMAITASTFTTFIVFLPLVLGEGEMGIWLRQVGVPITLSLLMSLLIALSIVPMAMTRYVKKPFQSEQKFIESTKNAYRKLLSLILQHPLPSFIGVLIMVASAFSISSKVEKNLEGDAGERQIVIQFKMPDNFTLSDSDTITRQAEDLLLAEKDKMGILNIYTAVSKDNAWVRLFLSNSGDDLPSETEVKDRIRELIPKVAGVKWWFGWREDDSASGKKVVVVINGFSNDRLMELAEEIKPLLARIPDVTNVRTQETEPMGEIQVAVDRKKAEQNGFNPMQIANVISLALMGQELPRLQESEHEVRVRMQLQETDRANLMQLQNLMLYTASGDGMPINSLADFSIAKGKSMILREKGKISQNVEIESKRDDLVSIRGDIERTLSQYRFPEGYGYNLGRSFEQYDAGMKEFGQMFLLAIILVLLLLGALFESLLHPFTIILSLPFAFVGVFWLMYLGDIVQDMMANIGFVLLIGIVVNNAIVLVDHINQLRKSGLSRRDALIQGGCDRFRPIIMTAGTTILGLAPMAFSGAGDSGFVYSTLAQVVMGGLFSSTILTLLVIPIFYVIMDEFQILLKRLLLSVSILLKLIRKEPKNGGETELKIELRPNIP